MKIAAFFLLASACASRGITAPGGRPAAAGIDLQGMDTAVAPGDDFFAYANGTWLKTERNIAADLNRLSGWTRSSYLQRPPDLDKRRRMS